MAFLSIDTFAGRLRRLRLYLGEVWRYYSHPVFRTADVNLIYSYLMHNPYTVAKEFALQKGDTSIYTYGETPLVTMDQIATCADIGETDVVYELGAGRGRTCFWLRCFKKCRVVGIEHNPEFIRRAQAVADKWQLGSEIQFLCEDFLETDLSPATVIYLDGTCLEPSDIHRLSERILTLKPGTRVVTVSYPLEGLILNETRTLAFSWADAEVYFQHVPLSISI